MQPGLSEEKRRREWDRRTWRSTFWTVLGYIIWNVDLEFCKELRMLRERVGLPWGWVLELHGWWHVLTAVGTSQFMDIAREIREEVRREKMK
jgi:dihydroceramidase